MGEKKPIKSTDTSPLQNNVIFFVMGILGIIGFFVSMVNLFILSHNEGIFSWVTLYSAIFSLISGIAWFSVANKFGITGERFGDLDVSSISQEKTELSLDELGFTPDEISYYKDIPILKNQYDALITMETENQNRALIKIKTVNCRVITMNTYWVKVLPENIDLLEDLVELNVSSNYISALPNSIAKLSKLEILNLVDNSLTTLPEEIGSLQSLQVLNLRHNQLSSLPESFWSLAKLTELDITNNKLGSCIPRLIELPILKKVSISKREYRKLSPEEKATIERLKANGCEFLFPRIPY